MLLVMVAINTSDFGIPLARSRISDTAYYNFSNLSSGSRLGNLVLQAKTKGAHPPRCILNKLGYYRKSRGIHFDIWIVNILSARSTSSYFTTSKILPNCCPLHQVPDLGDCTMGAAGLRLSRAGAMILRPTVYKQNRSVFLRDLTEARSLVLALTYKVPKKKRLGATWLRHMLLTSQVC